MPLKKQVNLIVDSAHSDPFEVLGAHPVAFSGEEAVAIRVFLPEAKEVSVIDLRNQKKENRINAEDILSWTDFIKKLRNNETVFEKKMHNALDKNTRDILTHKKRLLKTEKESILARVNLFLNTMDSFHREDWEDGGLSGEGLDSLLPASNNQKKYPMEKIHRKGFFEVVIENTKEIFPYQLEKILEDGSAHLMYDPYSFPPVLTDFDLHLMGEGSHYKKYEKLGAHLMSINGIQGACFSVWAPNAIRVSVTGNFNDWDGKRHPMRLRGLTGVWELFIPGLEQGTLYKFEVKSRHKGHMAQKADPYAFYSELRPNSASVVYDLNKYEWKDRKWMKDRSRKNWLESPLSIYEVHLGSWKRKPDEDNSWLTYEELAQTLIPYVKDMGYTHIQLLPVSEHPLDESWGYQTIGYYSCTSRFGKPEDFMSFVDQCHENGIGVIIDWVPAHFPKDAHGLGYFDGTSLYEHEDPRKGHHMDWGTLIFNYGRKEVANYLIANALFWLDKYHIDGLRVDAVASMLYHDYSRKEGEWIPNKYGGNENLEAVAFLKKFNEQVHANHPGVLTIAEESTAWPMVSRPTYIGGLGFSLKWNMGWMHDVLEYFTKDPVHRKFHHNDITFGLIYAFTENFIIVLSHDEVVHGKRSMLDKMPGDLWQKFANLRLLYSFMYAHPGKKLLFMGGEIGQWSEWNCGQSLNWELLQQEPHQKLQDFLKDLNKLYQIEPAMHEIDFEANGFEWMDLGDYENCVLSFTRKAKNPDDFLFFIFNFTPVPRHNYRIAVPEKGFYKEIFNSDSEQYWGSNVGNYAGVHTEDIKSQGRPQSLSLTLPPLGALIFKFTREKIKVTSKKNK